MKKFVLIDANALIHRAFHALPPLKSPKGQVTNAAYGFTSILFRAIKDIEPDYIAAAFDLPGPTFRHDAYEKYKSHRIKAPQELYGQIPITKEVLSALGIPSYELEGYEADDLIGALTDKFKKEKDLKVIIVTGDLDTLQLVDGNKVVVYTLKKGITDTTEYNEENVIKRYGLKPEQMPDFKGLKGDPSDNIPGVPGIGDKTAAALLKEFGNLENLYKEIKKEGGENAKISKSLIDKLLEYEEQAFFSKELGVIVKDLKIDVDLKKIDWKRNYDKEKLESIFKELGFSSLISRIPSIDKENKAEVQELQREEEKLIKRETKIEEITPDSLKEFKEKIRKSGKLIFAVSDNFENIYFSFNNGIYFLKTKEFLKDLREIFESEKILKISHNLKSTFKFFLKNGTHIKGLHFDTSLAFWLLNSDLKDYSLDKIYFSEFGESLFDGGGVRAMAVEKLYGSLGKKLKDAGLLKVFEDIEIPLIPVLAEMELNGIEIDRDSLEKLSVTVDKELKNLEDKIYSLAGVSFNIKSPRQLSEVLFVRLGLKTKVKKTGGGALSTAAPELEKLREEHPIIDLILSYRELQKLKTTYIDVFPEYFEKDRRIRTSFIQTGTSTGRLASQNPNLQNIPIRGGVGQEFRKVFIAGRDYSLVSFDYNQVELRIVAHMSKDEKMIRIFKQGEDIHLRTASEVFDVRPDQVTSNMRRQAKVLNFGVIYGMGILGFSRAAGVKRDKAEEFIKKYFEEFKGVADYIDKTKEEAKDKGFIKTMFGRRRQLVDIYSGIPELQRQAERMAINMPIQGCLPYLTKVLTSEGYIPIGELYKMRSKPEYVWTGTNWAKYEVLNRGKAQLSEIHFSNGQILKCDVRHEVLTVNEKGYKWVKFNELQNGDKVCFSLPITLDFKPQKLYFSHTPKVGNSKALKLNGLSKDFYYWLGYYYGDGHFTERYTPGGSNKNKLYKKYELHYTFGKDNLEKSKECLKFFQKLGLNPTIREIKSDGRIRYSLGITSSGLGKLFKKIGVTSNENAKTKRLVPIVFKERVKNRLSFVKGMMDSDGCYGHEIERYTPNIHLSQRGLLEDIQLVIRTLGVDSKIRGPYEYRGLKSHRLNIPKRRLFRALGLSHSQFSRDGYKLTPKFIIKKFLNKYPNLGKRFFKKNSDYILYRRWYSGGSSSIYHFSEFLKRYNLNLEVPLYDWYSVVGKKVLNKFETTYTLWVKDRSHRFDSEGVISKNTAADLMKLAMIEVFKYIHKFKEGDIKILLQIHDELLCEIKNEVIEDLTKELKQVMENVYLFDVPLIVDVKAGDNWGEMTKIKYQK